MASLSPQVDFRRRFPDGKLRIGYYASDTQVNRECLLEFLECRAASAYLSSNSMVILAGGFCKSVSGQFDENKLRELNVRIMGRVDDLTDLFRDIDVLVNPDKGGTGLKIKSLEPMYFGLPVICTRAGGGGLESKAGFMRLRISKA